MTRLGPLENVYEWLGGIWVAEYKFGPGEPWETLGQYTSRCAAVAALVPAR